MNNNITVSYNASVLTKAGWRAVVMTAQAQRISAKRVRIVAVIEIDGEHVTRNMTRTGSARQSYNAAYFAGAECGKIKNIGVN